MLSVGPLIDVDTPPVDSLSPSLHSPVVGIILFAATVWEFNAIRAALPPGQVQIIDGLRAFVGRAGQREYWLVRTGVGSERAGSVARRMFSNRPWALAVSTGFACALTPAGIGDLLVATETVDSTGAAAAPLSAGVSDPERDRLVAVALQAAGAHAGRFLSVDRIVCRASEKREFHRSSGAIGLDMESAALAREARTAQVPFAIVRTVSDLIDEDLPLDFNLFLRPTGWLAGLASLAAAPVRLAGLGRLRRQSRLAAENLTGVFRTYVASCASEAVRRRAVS